MIKLEDNYISNIVISTSLGFYGAGMFPYSLDPRYRKVLRIVKDKKITVLTKSATRYNRLGNFALTRPWTWKYIKTLPDKKSLLNAYGLTNKGAEVHAKNLHKSYKKGLNVIPNFYPEFSKGIDKAISQTKEAVNLYKKYNSQNFWAIELNFSCPNSKEIICENTKMSIDCVREIVRDFPALKIIAKTSIVHPYEFYQELENVGVHVIHAVNTVPYNMVFGDDKASPFYRVGSGGVSGAAAFDLAYKYNKELRKKVNIPIIMGCGVSSADDVKKLFDIGANSVSICTMAVRNIKETISVLYSD
ncbi:Dihydroorotate dehydrogenase, classes 1 and 2 [Candidatus Magnetoovum chiemensis]|nr:Dihydroorotate dehydrogenase, classes 1 and 2 [Candidatus Magnetoovum chiemensis]